MTVLWQPSAERRATANLTAFLRAVRDTGVVGIEDFGGLYDWSVAHPERFWPLVWRFCGVVAEARGAAPPTSGAQANHDDPGRQTAAPWDEVVVGLERMAPPDPELGPRWFPGSRLNYAENLLRYRDDREALVFWNESGRRSSLTYAGLHHEVARLAAALAATGVGPGDRVAGYLPNLPETIVALLASAALGATWSSCSPDFGVQAVLDRFGQLGPKVLFAADGYTYAGRAHDCLTRLREIASRLPGIERVVVVPYLDPRPDIAAVRGAVTLPAFAAESGGAADLPFARFPFDHPLYVLFSSGTTGLPKGLVHGAGGTLLQHLKEHVLHTDLTREDRVFYFTTCGWMMWNWLAGCLAVGGTVVLYDGSPVHPHPAFLFDLAERERLTVFGTSARYLALAQKEGLAPRASHDLSPLRTILSTGSPLSPASFDYVYARVKEDLCLSSISGGTDILSCFALGNPLGPVRRGELQARGLGMKVEIWDEEGRPQVGRPGELVCTLPFPSMPLRFWNDPGGAKYHAAYFARFPDAWRHGDWAELTPGGGLVIHGRSDATLNPGGVRLGSGEIYRQVEAFPEVLESVAVGQEWGGDTRVVLFVRLRQGLLLDAELRERLRLRLRQSLSPRHVPSLIVQVPDIPRTISGKISEIAVREAIHGRPVENTGALANPGALKLFQDLAELRPEAAGGAPPARRPGGRRRAVPVTRRAPRRHERASPPPGWREP